MSAQPSTTHARTRASDVATRPHRTVPYRAMPCRAARLRGRSAACSSDDIPKLRRFYARTSSRRRQRWWMFFIYEEAQDQAVRAGGEGRRRRRRYSSSSSSSPLLSSLLSSLSRWHAVWTAPREKAGNLRDYASVTTGTRPRRRATCWPPPFGADAIVHGGSGTPSATRRREESLREASTSETIRTSAHSKMAGNLNGAAEQRTGRRRCSAGHGSTVPRTIILSRTRRNYRVASRRAVRPLLLLRYVFLAALDSRVISWDVSDAAA